MSHAATGAFDPHHDATTTTGIPNKKLFMWLFLASDCMFFGSLIATHLIYRLNPIEGSPNPTQIFDIELTSASTFILLMSSLMMALAVEAAGSTDGSAVSVALREVTGGGTICTTYAECAELLRAGRAREALEAYRKAIDLAVSTIAMDPKDSSVLCFPSGA